MQPLNLKSYIPKKGANSQISYWRDLTAKLLKVSFPQVCGLTRGWKMEWIRDMFLNFKGKPALWWHVYRHPKESNAKQ